MKVVPPFKKKGSEMSCRLIRSINRTPHLRILRSIIDRKYWTYKGKVYMPLPLQSCCLSFSHYTQDYNELDVVPFILKASDLDALEAENEALD
jgi:hypothetical protein